MNPSEMRLLQNLNTRIADLSKVAENLQKQVTTVNDFAMAELKKNNVSITNMLAAVTSMAENFTPFVCKVSLPKHLRELPQLNIMDLVDGVMGAQSIPVNPYHVEHGDEVLVLSGITNKPGMVVVVNEDNRLLWPLPLSIFEKVE